MSLVRPCPYCRLVVGDDVDLLSHLQCGRTSGSPVGCQECTRWWALPAEVAWLVARGVPAVIDTREVSNYSTSRTVTYFPLWLRRVLEAAHTRSPSGFAASWLLDEQQQTARDGVELLVREPARIESVWAAFRLGGNDAVCSLFAEWSC